MRVPKKMRYIAVLLGIFFVFSFMTSRAQEDNIIRVGYPDGAAIIKQYADGSYYGYMVEYLEKIGEYTGWEYEYVQASFVDLCDMLEKGEIDLVCVMQMTEERKEKYLFSDYYAGWEYTSLYVEQDKNVTYEDFFAFKGMKIGFIEDSQANLDFKDYAKYNAFVYVPYYYETSAEMDAALAAGELDAITRNNIRVTENLKLVARFSAEPYYFTANLQNERLMAEPNRVLSKMKLENPHYLERLQEKYNTDKVEAELTLAERSYIENCPELRIAYFNGLGLVSYKQEGRLMGVSAELFDRIIEETGLKCKFVEYVTPQAALNAVMTNQADMIVGIDTRNQLADKLILTNSYFEIPLNMATRENTELEGVIKIALRGADEELENYIADAFPEHELHYCNTPEECLTLLEEGKVEFVLEDSFLISATIAAGTYQPFLINNIADYNTQICIGLNKEADEVLVQILNKVIAGITNSERTQMVAQALSRKQVDTSFIELLKQNMDKLLIVVLCSVVAVMIVTGIQRRNRAIQLEKIAYYDDLTGMRKQEKFVMDAQIVLEENRDRKYALVYMDIERFRYLNTVLGRKNSDEVLKLLGRALEDSLKAGELCGRIYADDFIVLYEYSDETELMKRIKEVQRQFRVSVSEGGIYYKVFSRAGAYLIEDRMQSCEEMIYRAVLAKQTSKAEESVYFFDEYLEKKLHKELEIESIMEEALLQEEFRMFLQPKYSTNGEELVGAEALVRWIRPDGSTIYPNDFIPLFENNGFILKLDYYMYRKALIWLRERLDNGLPVVCISVNLSRLHNGDSHMAERLSRMAQDFEIPPQLIEFELTESAFSENETNVLEQLSILQKAGFAISIDDFGSGYSSLNLLRKVRADVLKIDKGFLDETEDSERSANIIRDIVSLAKDIHMHVICEGVETAEQLAFLREIQCDYAQGYYFAKPLPTEEFEKLVKGKE